MLDDNLQKDNGGEIRIYGAKYKINSVYHFFTEKSIFFSSSYSYFHSVFLKKNEPQTE